MPDEQLLPHLAALLIAGARGGPLPRHAQPSPAGRSRHPSGRQAAASLLANQPHMPPATHMPATPAWTAAGFETTAHSISWTLYELARRPDLQQRAYDELAAAGLAGAGALSQSRRRHVSLQPFSGFLDEVKQLAE